MSNHKSFKLEELAKLTDSYVIGDPECVVDNLSTISSASESSITFLTNSRYSGNLKNSKACAVLVDESYKEDKDFNYLKSKDPYLAYATLSKLFKEESNNTFPFVDKSAVISENSVISKNVYIGPHVYIGPNCVIEDNVTINANCSIVQNAVSYTHLRAHETDS